MKKLTGIIMALVLVFSMSACGTKPGDMVQSEVSIAQSNIIASLGVTVENERIVAYQNEDTFVRYLVVYYEGGKKTDEQIHYFFNSPIAYENEKAIIDSPSEIKYDDEKQYINLKGYSVSSESYAEALEKIKNDYFIK